MSRTAACSLLSVALLALAEAPKSPDGTPLRKIGEMELSVLGISATVEPVNPVVPKNTRSGLRVVVRAGATELSVGDVERFLGGPFSIEADLAGPGLSQPVSLPVVDPAQPAAASSDPLLLPLPPLLAAGDYTIANLRLVVNGKPALDVEPRAITLQVIDQILVTSVTTRALTLDELKARGVVLDSDDYLGFEFSLGMLLESSPIDLSFPVVFDRKGVALPRPIGPPLDPARERVGVEIPTIVPMMLDVAEGENPVTIELPDGTDQPVRIPSLLVIPGDVGFLKQFFSALLIVANGAPGGSGLVVRDVVATVELPPGADRVQPSADDPLSLPETVIGFQPGTLPVRGLGADGVADTTDDLDAFGPGAQGQAEFLIRGEKEGFHTLDFDIEATLDGLPTGPVRLTGQASGGVLVRNPFFDVTFAAPGTVRQDEPFDLFVTVTNIGPSLANDVRVTLDTARMSGVEIGSDDATQSIPTLAPGDARTLSFGFTSQRTGQVVASYLELDEGGPSTGNLKFTLGVDERGVPLSPDTLVLPTSVDALPPGLVRAAMRVLGQGWSLANAPAGTLPAGVLRTSRRVVTRKALSLAEAGLRVDLGQSLSAAAGDLAFDFYGGDRLDLGFDQLLRETDAGHDFGLALGAELASASAASGGALLYERDLAGVAASGPDFASFAVSPAAPVAVSLSDGAGRRTEASTSEGERPLSEVPGAVLLPLGTAGQDPVLGLLTSPVSSPYTIELAGFAPGSTSVSVSLPRGDGSFVRGTTSLSVAAGSRARLVLDLFRPDSIVLEEDGDGDGVFESESTLATAAFSSPGPSLVSATVIGPEILDGASPFGFHVALLFDRVVDEAGAAEISRYSIASNGLQGARRELSGRLVFASLEQPEGPYVPASLTVSGLADARGVTGPATTVELSSRLSDPGAVVSGRILNADGTPFVSGAVGYANTSADSFCQGSREVLFAETPTTDDGRFEFRYVRQDPCGGPFRILNQEAGTGALRSVSGFVRAPGEHITLDLVLFGSGGVTGIVTESGVPVPDAEVVVVSGTDAQSGAATRTDGDGRYFVDGILVGPVSVKAAKGGLLGSSTGRIARGGTTATVNVNLESGSVRALGTVSKLEQGVASPIPGIQVVYSVFVPELKDTVPVAVATTLSDGTYVLENLPPGQYVLEAILNTRDRGSLVGTSAPGDTIAGDIVIAIPEAGEVGTVRGTVVLPDGAPASDVVVSIGLRGVLSGADGSFELSGVAVQPNVPQTLDARTRDGLRSGRSTVILNTPGQIVENVTVVLSGLGTAAFTVLDENGAKIAGQEVRLLGACQSPCGCRAKTTGPDGVASFDDVPLGRASAKAILFGTGLVDVAAGHVSIPADGETGFGVLRFQGAGTVTGTVLLPDGTKALGSDVTLRSLVYDAVFCELRSGVSHRARTGDDGRFQLDAVNLGNVGVSATHPFFDTSVGAQGTLTTSSRSIDFTLGLVDTVSGELSGTIFLPDGVTPAGAGVEVTADGALPEVVVETDEDGRYAFAPIFPQGPYEVTVRDPVTGGLARERIFLRAGLDAVHDLRLEGRGTVRVRVVDGADQPVEQAFVRLQEIGFPSGLQEKVIEAASQGVATFTNVFEGPFSIEAFDAFGRDGGRTASVLPGPGDTVEVEVRLTTTGSVTGRFLMPPDDTPIPFGVVELISGGQVLGRTTTLGAGDVGSFFFDFVPAGPVRLEAQDFLTARTGVAVGEIQAQDEVLTLDVIAQALGTVQGVVTSNGAPQESAHVDVVSGSYRACTFTDASGTYLVEGVPEGRVVVTASLGGGFLSGTSADTLSGEGTILELDVALRDAGGVTGRVLPAGGAGPAPRSVVTIQVGGVGGGTQSTTTDAAGGFAFDRVPAGLATLTVDALGSIDTARTTVEVPSAGSVSVDVFLNGVGSITGTTRDSAGSPTAGTVTVRGAGDFPYGFTLSVGVDGTFHLPEVLAGPFTATLRTTDGGFTLYGTASGVVQPDADVPVEIQLQPSGTVTGVVRRADGGGTPALGANVTLSLLGGGSVTVQVQNDGRFTALGVPLGGFRLRVTDPLTGGVALLEGLSLDVNEQVLDLGEIVLDDSPISVVAIDPADGAVGVPIDQPVLVSFSDPVQFFSGAIRVVDEASTVPLAASLSADGLTVTLSGSLPDARELTVEVSTGVTDVFGRRLLQTVTSRFRTVDLTPPRVVAVAPADLAIEVDVGASVEVTFDEPLSATTDLASLVTLAGPTGVVSGPTVSAPGAVTFTFTPDAPLAVNARYTVTVIGAVDESGNTQMVAFQSSFSTPDSIAPIVQLDAPAPGGWVTGARPLVRVTMADGVSGLDMTTATLDLDGAPVVADVVGADFLAFTPAADLSEGTHSVASSVADRSGNVGGFSASFSVDTIAPGAAAVSGVANGQVVRDTITLGATATDDGSGVSRIELLRDGALLLSVEPPVFEAVLDTNTLPEGAHTLTARAVDVAGNVGPEGAPVSVVVDNRVLTVSITSPAEGTRFRDGVTVTATVSEPSERVEFSIGSQTVADTVAPYEATLDLASVADGDQPILVTAFGPAGDTATASRTIVVDRTPPAPPDAGLISAEPPESGSSLVFGRAGAVEAGAVVDAANTVNGAAATTSADATGSFALSLAAAADDTLSLTATDDVGNTSAPTTIVVRRTPSLPPSEDATSLRFEGVLVDRVGPGAAALAPDGLDDAVFTMSLSIGDGITRQLSHIDLEGPALRSTRPEVGSVLGVAIDAGAAFLNDADGRVSFPITTGATLTLFAADEGFVQEGQTYTVTAFFTDGSRFVGTFTIVAAADRTLVAHSARVEAAPATAEGTPAAPGVASVLVTDIRDVEGVLVPDGAKIGIAVAGMASTDPRGNPISSAGGEILDGAPAANHPDFRVFPISGGEVLATYSTGPVTPAPVLGALAVVQVIAVDADDNVLGTEAIATLDLNLAHPDDAAVVSVSPSSLYADRADRRSLVTVAVRDGSGLPAADGTRVLVSASFCAGRIAGACVASEGGDILGGDPSPTSSIYRALTVANGTVQAEYAPNRSVGVGDVLFATIQVLPADADGGRTSTETIGTARIALVGPGSAEMSLSPESVPYVFPERAVQVRVQHLHDSRSNLVPDGAVFLLSASSCATRVNGVCVSSDGGAIVDGAVSPTSSIYKSFALDLGELSATYSTGGLSAPPPGQARTAGIQLGMADPAGARLDTEAVAVVNLPVVAPTHAVGSAEPPAVLADGRLRTATVTFRPVLDALGNPLPDGSRVVASAASCGGRVSGACVPSAGGQIVNGEPSPSGANYKLLTIQNGEVSILYGNQGISSLPGQVKEANVVLLEAREDGRFASTEAVGVVPVALPGLTTASAAASPPSLQADGSDRRSTITLSDFRDASGNPIEDGTVVALSASFCAARVNGACVLSDGGAIVGGRESPFLASHYRLFDVTNGQVVAQYSSQGVAVASGEKTAVVQVLAVRHDDRLVGTEALATVPVQLLAPASATVSVSPMDLLGDGGERPAQIVVSDLVEPGGFPVPDGASVALTAIDCAAQDPDGACLLSAGGEIRTAGTTPGDGDVAANDPSFQLFTVTGGEVRAVYSSAGIVAGVDETLDVRIAVVPADGTGSVTSTTAYGSGTLHLHGTTSASASGPSSLSLAGGIGTVVFSGIKDSAGNTVPDGTKVAATVADCGTLDAGGLCVTSAGGELTSGEPSSSGASWRVFTVVDGSVSVAYSTASATEGTARIQLAPASPDGTVIGNRALLGGVWELAVTP